MPERKRIRHDEQLDDRQREEAADRGPPAFTGRIVRLDRLRGLSGLRI
jgi:hypothetical protein